MARFKTDGFAGVIDDEAKQLSKKTHSALSQGLYEGAGVFADEIRREVQSLNTDLGYVNTDKGHKPLSGILPRQKEGLLDGLGIADFKTEKGAIVTEVGFTGYNKHHTKQYPDGQPNALVARSLVKGTSYVKPNKFVTRAYNRAKSKAESKIVETITRILHPDHK